MQTFRAISIAVFLVCVSKLGRAAEQPEAGIGPSFKGPIGLQLYSLRDAFAKDVPGTLDKVRDFGFTNVELAGTYGLPPEKFREELKSRGLVPISAHFPFERFKNDIENVAQEAEILGVQCVGCASLPHRGDFDEKECREAIAVLNRAGERLAKDGIKFFYHTHGFEFQPHGAGTLFDLLVTETKPEHVTFEMDVFWVVHAGHNPAALLEKYPDRFALVHLKDMKKGTPTGVLTGSTDVSNDVALGTGQVDFRRTLAAAKKVGVKWYFVEDESPRAAEQIPLSLRYLEQVQFADSTSAARPIRLFDGKSFADWTARDGGPVTKNWKIEDGMLALDGIGGSIFTKEEYGDFDLSFEWKIAPKGNSGVKYHVNFYRKGVRGRPGWLGCEYQLYDDSSSKPTTKNSSGALYDLYPPVGERELRPAGAFNQSRIVVHGPKIEHWLNGARVVSVDMRSDDWKKRVAASKFAPAKDFMTKPKGRIELQDHRSRVWFKNLELTPLESDE
jgi:sugar phosphate isomerase/epimerase